jgi:hypothetical protein
MSESKKYMTYREYMHRLHMVRCQELQKANTKAVESITAFEEHLAMFLQMAEEEGITIPLLVYGSGNNQRACTFRAYWDPAFYYDKLLAGGVVKWLEGTLDARNLVGTTTEVFEQAGSAKRELYALGTWWDDTVQSFLKKLSPEQLLAFNREAADAFSRRLQGMVDNLGSLEQKEGKQETDADAPDSEATCE